MIQLQFQLQTQQDSLFTPPESHFKGGVLHGLFEHALTQDPRLCIGQARSLCAVQDMRMHRPGKHSLSLLQALGHIGKALLRPGFDKSNEKLDFMFERIHPMLFVRHKAIGFVLLFLAGLALCDLFNLKSFPPERHHHD